MDEQNTRLSSGTTTPAGEPIGTAGAPGAAGLDAATAQRTSEIRSEIERTREDMSETIDAIQDRLRPGRVASRAAGSIRDAAARKMRQVKHMTYGDRDDIPRRAADWYRGNGVLERIRENPIPAALALGSIAWLAFSRRPSRDYAGPPPYERWQDPEVLYGQHLEADYDTSGDYAELRSGGGRAGVQRAREAASQARRRVRDMGSHTGRRVRDMARQNTLAAALLAAGIGIAIGLALPETERENELLGETRDSMMNRAKQAAHGAAEQVQETAQNVQRAAGEAIKAMGTSEEGSTSRSSTPEPAPAGTRGTTA